jgi:hypothetical protein
LQCSWPRPGRRSSPQKEYGTNTQELAIAWLNDGHAVENALVRVLEHRVKDAKD